MDRQLLKDFENFLAGIPLEKYRKELMPVKTVEQDLPPKLNPLPAIYESYWHPERRDSSPRFPDYEEFFEKWWERNTDAIDDFKRTYFWGCSYEFVRLGFKARIYRTLISVLTQFHFAYTWLVYCRSHLSSSPELDMRGLDAKVEVKDIEVGIQIKKQTYRSEAKGPGRFSSRRYPVALIIEVPYTLLKEDEWKHKADRARKEETRTYAEYFRVLAKEYQRWLENDFVVFAPDYAMMVERFAIEKTTEIAREKTPKLISWEQTLK